MNPSVSIGSRVRKSTYSDRDATPTGSAGPNAILGFGWYPWL
jgi:hypothetical protein